jgi:hypothetical protein
MVPVERPVTREVTGLFFLRMRMHTHTPIDPQSAAHKLCTAVHS